MCVQGCGGAKLRFEDFPDRRVLLVLLLFVVVVRVSSSSSSLTIIVIFGSIFGSRVSFISMKENKVWVVGENGDA